VTDPDGAVRLNLRLSRQDIAQLSGATLETVSRTLTQWERDGLVRTAREQVTLTKPHDLVLLAEDIES
jgi:CRP/FNR family transcriptional regulator, nitrogen oxide reductase regulator